ncbi:MAG: hypothetical protein FWF47_07660 [Clostridia bacterium]|nr:hypothetical protein [Clostridia bacterium]
MKAKNGPLLRCALFIGCAVLSRCVFANALYGVLFSLTPFYLYPSPGRPYKHFIKLAVQKNAARSIVWIRRFACWSLAGTAYVLCAGNDAGLLSLAALAAGGALGILLRAVSRERDPSFTAAMGALFWLAGFFFSMGTSPVFWFLSPAAMGLGMMIAFAYLSVLDGFMDAVCSLLIGREVRDTARYFDRFSATADILAAWFFFTLTGFTGVIPASLLLAAAAALRFPLKLVHLKRLPKPGEQPSKALEAQLMPFLTRRRKRRHFIWLIRRGMQLIWRGGMAGAENLPPPGTDGVVLLCNHGFVQGTIFSRLWLDRPFRSWSISDLMVREDAYPHIRQYQVNTITWLPNGLRDPLTKVLIRLFAWLFDSLDSIPVYRNRLRKLMETFRATSDALECGDAVMIYPENPDDPGLDKPGYTSQAIAPFFSGFTMIGSFYHARTGKAVTYIPMYCSKKTRLLYIGAPIVHDLQNDPAAEKERIVTLSRNAMIAFMEAAEGIPSAANRGASAI